MTNYEKNKTLLNMYAVSDITWGVNKDGKAIDCIDLCDEDCIDCIFCKKGRCSQERLKWLQDEYKDPELEVWSKVPIDMPIWVKDSKDSRWIERPFAGYYFGKVHAFGLGRTSKDYSVINAWNYAKLAEGEEEVKND